MLKDKTYFWKCTSDRGDSGDSGDGCDSKTVVTVVGGSGGSGDIGEQWWPGDGEQWWKWWILCRDSDSGDSGE
jgi:hypothetical protein